MGFPNFSFCFESDMEWMCSNVCPLDKILDQGLTSHHANPWAVWGEVGLSVLYAAIETEVMTGHSNMCTCAHVCGLVHLLASSSNWIWATLDSLILVHDKVRCFSACQFVKQVVHCSRSCLRHGILAFCTSVSCHSWRFESTERSCRWWPGRQGLWPIF